MQFVLNINGLNLQQCKRMSAVLAFTAAIISQLILYHSVVQI